MRKLSYIIYVLFATMLLAVSCSEPEVEYKGKPNTNPEHNHDQSTVQGWICKNMCDWYLWSDDVKALKPDYKLEYSPFFRSLLSTNRLDGKMDVSGVQHFYSQISRKAVGKSGSRSVQTDQASFGFEFFMTQYVVPKDGTFDQNEKEELIMELFAVVTYVVPNSPAYKMGLSRGCAIEAINGEKITIDNYAQKIKNILPEGYTQTPLTTATVTACELTTTGSIATDTNKNRYPILNLKQLSTITLTPEPVNDNAVHLAKVLTVGAKRVGYLVYNEFETGEPTWDNHDYDNEMKRAFKLFKEQGVTELVLDLRYNGGGYLSCCQLMSSMIVKNSQLGRPMFQLKHNDHIAQKYPSRESIQNFLIPEQMASKSFGTESGINLNMAKIYVLGTGNTASASECVINSLRGCADGGVKVYLIGTKTEGKNVGMDQIDKQAVGGGSFDGYEYTMLPISFYVYNAQGKADYSNGFAPDYVCEEDDIMPLKPLGDKDEVMLAAALKHIETNAFPVTKSTSTSISRANTRNVEFNSVSLKPNRGLINRTDMQ